MNMERVREIASAILYEGYLLYPYRHSAIKNRQRWTFGVVYPRAYSEASGGLEPWNMRTECLLEGHAGTLLDISVRFLHLLTRSVTQSVPAGAQARHASEISRGDSLLLAGQFAYEPWEEGIEREVKVTGLPVRELLVAPRRVEIALSSGRHVECAADEGEPEIAREQRSLIGAVVISAERVPGDYETDLYRLSVQIENTTPVVLGEEERRDAILLQSFVSTHTILRVHEGSFVSLLETPEEFQEAAQACQNRRTWPVLVGEPGERDIMLSSPIILYDYPQIAPESPGALFDGTEIDEILALRILTLSDEEKEELRRGDERVRKMLEWIEALSPEQFLQLHGAIRELRPLADGQSGSSQGFTELEQAYPGFEQIDPGEDYAPPASVRLGEREARVGDRVCLHPKARADAFDLLLDGKSARIEAVQQDFENRFYLVVTLDDDPGREQWDERVLPGHRFFFFPEEVELLDGVL
jgi:hypothetical protein